MIIFIEISEMFLNKKTRIETTKASMTSIRIKEGKILKSGSLNRAEVALQIF